MDTTLKSCQFHSLVVLDAHLLPIVRLLDLRRPGPDARTAWQMVIRANTAARRPIGTVNAKVMGPQSNLESCAWASSSLNCSRARRRQSVEFSFSGQVVAILKLGKSEDQEKSHVDIAIVRSNEVKRLKMRMERQAGGLCDSLWLSSVGDSAVCSATTLWNFIGWRRHAPNSNITAVSDRLNAHHAVGDLKRTNHNVRTRGS
jgi:hypothetical protein